MAEAAGLVPGGFLKKGSIWDSASAQPHKHAAKRDGKTTFAQNCLYEDLFKTLSSLNKQRVGRKIELGTLQRSKNRSK